MNSKLDWQSVKTFYKEHFGIDGWVVELFANMDILLLCVSGVSNKHIEEFLELPFEEIHEVVSSTFLFDGWIDDLPLNPYKIYNDVGEKEFIKEAQLALVSYVKFRDILDLDDILVMCKTMKDIEGKINDEWV